MRLWHYKLIPYLDRQHLLGQHRECCALRGKGWGKKHATVDYVFKHDPRQLYIYHELVMKEMNVRCFVVDEKWHDAYYRGQYCMPWQHIGSNIDMYPEHDDAYLQFCIDKLEKKGINVSAMRKDLLEKKNDK